jgi:hypothetical protein
VHSRQRSVGSLVLAGGELDEGQRGEKICGPPRLPRALGLLDQRQKRRAAALDASAMRVHERPRGEGHGRRAADEGLFRHGAAPLGVLRREAPASGPELDEREVSEPVSAQPLLAVLAIPLVLRGVARSGGVEGVDAVEPDERDRVGPAALLQRQSLLEKLAGRIASQERLGEDPVDQRSGEKLGLSILTQQMNRRIRVHEGSARVERHAHQGEPREDPALECVILRSVRQSALEVLARFAHRAGIPFDSGEHPESLRPQDRRNRGRNGFFHT